MIRIHLTDINGRKIDFFVSSTTVVEVREPASSQYWHGIRANIKVGDGNWQEVRETPDHIAKLLGAA